MCVFRGMNRMWTEQNSSLVRSHTFPPCAAAESDNETPCEQRRSNQNSDQWISNWARPPGGGVSGTSLMNMIHAVIINSLLSRHVDLYFMEFHIGSVFYQLLPKLQQLDKICRSIWNHAPIKHITVIGIIMSVMFQASSFLQDSLLCFVTLRFGLLVAQKKQFEDTCRAIY